MIEFLVSEVQCLQEAAWIKTFLCLMQWGDNIRSWSLVWHRLIAHLCIGTPRCVPVQKMFPRRQPEWLGMAWHLLNLGISVVVGPPFTSYFLCLGCCSCSLGNGDVHCPSIEPVTTASASGPVPPSFEKSKCPGAVRGGLRVKKKPLYPYMLKEHCTGFLLRLYTVKRGLRICFQ